MCNINSKILKTTNFNIQILVHMATRVYYSTYKTVYSSAIDWTFDLR